MSALSFILAPDLGDVLFYRDKKGQALRRPADQYRIESKSQ